MARTRAAADRQKKTTQPVPGKTNRPSPKPPAIRGERRVKETDATVPVGPARRRRGTHDAPTDPAAVDHRKQFSGTDEPADPKRETACRPAGGNAGRRAVGLPDNT
jgi:hypothetical protein